MTINESKLYKSLPEDKKTIIRNVNKFLEELWEGDSLIQHYTEHGSKHSLRIIRAIEDFPCICEEGFLDDAETFVLLLAILLHDIGMQCDIRVLSNVLKIAGESYDAVFLENYSLESQLTMRQQAEIRANHHLLTAAWMKYAYTSNTHSRLKHVIMDIPNTLIGDIIDVCRFHSKLNINECSEHFTYNVKLRKQLLAALLRLADELDIGSDRVSSLIINDFFLPNENKVFWLLHQNTSVHIQENFIDIFFSLRSNDANKYGDLISSHFYEFKFKNERLLKILLRHGIALQFSGDPIKIIINDFAKELQTNIFDTLLRQQQLNVLRQSGLNLRHEVSHICFGLTSIINWARRDLHRLGRANNPNDISTYIDRVKDVYRETDAMVDRLRLFMEDHYLTIKGDEYIQHKKILKVQQLISDVYTILYDKASSEKITFVNDINPEITVYADEVCCNQLFYNIFLCIVGSCCPDSCVKITHENKQNNIILSYLSKKRIDIYSSDESFYDHYELTQALTTLKKISSLMGWNLEISNTTFDDNNYKVEFDIVFS